MTPALLLTFGRSGPTPSDTRQESATHASRDLMTHPLTWIATLRGWIRALVRRDVMERQVLDDIQFHLDMETELNVRRGMSPSDARRAALMAFGGVERT